MKTPITLCALAAFSHLSLAADKPVEAGLIEVHGEHVVLVENTMSPEGRYAGGWTVAPKKGQPPVKWKAWGSEDGNFRDDYLDNEGYQVTDVIVDLSKHTVAARLLFQEPYFTGKGHGGLEVAYGPGHDGHRYAIALSDSKWEASDVVLVDLADDGATQTDIHQTLDGAVLAYIRAHQKHTGGYATDYQLFSLPEIGLLTGFSDAATVRVPFSSEVPKSDSMRGYSGTLLLHLSTEKGHPRAEPGPIRETKGNPDPAVDDPRLAEADKELNVAYAAVRSKLDAAGKAKLVAEQREWIRQRDLSVAGLSANNAQDSPVANPRIAADRLLLQLTKERTAALRAR